MKLVCIRVVEEDAVHRVMYNAYFEPKTQTQRYGSGDGALSDSDSDESHMRIQSNDPLPYRRGQWYELHLEPCAGGG